MRNWIKRLFILVLISLFAFSLTACGDEDSNDAEDGEKTLELIYQAPDDTFESWMNKVKEEFEAEHDGVEVEITAIDSDEGDYPNKKVLMMKSDKTSPDIVMEDTEQLKPDAEAGYLEPITDELEDWSDWDQFYESVKEGVTGNDGELYGIPISTDVRGLWYNKNILENAGIEMPWEPETWDDVLSAAEAIKDDVEVPFWINSGKAMGEGTTMQTFLPLLYGTGSELYDEEDDKWIVESEGFLDTLKFIEHVYSNDLGASLSWATTGQAGAKVSTELMPEEEVGIALDGNWLPGNWEEDGNAPWPEWEDAIDLAPLPTKDGQEPGYSTVSGGWALSVPSNADHKDLAVEFIKLATTKDNLRYGTQLTPREDIAELDEYNQLTYQDKMTSFLEFTNYRPTYDEYPEISSNIQDAAEAVTTGNMTPEEAMEQFKEDVERDVGEENTKKE
ncbi:MAG TPA: extracellular solute-binding protein [Bacillota bacterium]|nr:extracellular solute-binding protein [Bacillota bacterium]